MARFLHQLSDAERDFLRGYARGDMARYKAVLLRHFAERPVREVADETGVPKSTVVRWAIEFKGLYDEWVAGRAAA